jgi:hypothetical protein
MLLWVGLGEEHGAEERDGRLYLISKVNVQYLVVVGE